MKFILVIIFCAVEVEVVCNWVFRRRDYPKFHKVVFFYAPIFRTTPRKKWFRTAFACLKTSSLTWCSNRGLFGGKKNSLLSFQYLFFRQRIFCHFFRSFSSFLLDKTPFPSFLVSCFFCKKLSDFFQGWPFPRISMPDPARPGPAPHRRQVQPGPSRESARPAEIWPGPAPARVGLAKLRFFLPGPGAVHRLFSVRKLRSH